FNNTSGISNVAIGVGTMNGASGTSIGSLNTAVGTNSLFNNTSGNGNTLLGFRSLFSNTSGDNNVAIGRNAGENTSTGFANTAVGYNSMLGNQTGSQITVLGTNANVGVSNLTNATAIGANAVVNESNTLVLGNNANVGIGVSAPLAKLHVIGNTYNNLNSENITTGIIDAVGVAGSALATDQGYGIGGKFTGGWKGIEGLVTITNPGTWVAASYGVYGRNTNPGGVNYGVFGEASGGTSNYGVFCMGNGGFSGTWTLVSDGKFKENISTLQSVLPLVRQLKPVNYNLKRKEFGSMNFPEGKQFGFIAQDLEKIFPTLVEDGAVPDENRGASPLHFKSVNYIGMIPILTKAIQEQQDEIGKQQSKLEQQDRLINELLRRVEALERTKK
ncbi:MAG TPA: tail fiber domain-containing protein, partial [Chitinophagaceae bacterium]|nr:tail fiber domain-containing protein [Chitinophagaceae bacterium]